MDKETIPGLKIIGPFPFRFFRSRPVEDSDRREYMFCTDLTARLRLYFRFCSREEQPREGTLDFLEYTGGHQPLPVRDAEGTRYELNRFHCRISMNGRERYAEIDSPMTEKLFLKTLESR